MLIGGLSSLSFMSFIVSETTREFNVDFLHTQIHLNTRSTTTVFLSVFTFQILLCMCCTYHVFFLFLLCCNASAFVICVIKNYLITYLTATMDTSRHPQGRGALTPGKVVKCFVSLVMTVKRLVG